jgi:hypothetical protein
MYLVLRHQVTLELMLEASPSNYFRSLDSKNQVYKTQVVILK